MLRRFKEPPIGLLLIHFRALAGGVHPTDIVQRVSISGACCLLVPLQGSGQVHRSSTPSPIAMSELILCVDITLFARFRIPLIRRSKVLLYALSALIAVSEPVLRRCVILLGCAT